MSEPVELAFRSELATAFAADLGERVFDLVNPPETTTPLATYRRVGGIGGSDFHRQARIQMSLRHPSYTAVKRLQKRIEAHFVGLVRVWMGIVDPDECRVWVHSVDAVTMPDAFQASTRLRYATSEFVVRYADVAPV